VAGLIPNAKHVVISSSDHMLMAAAPDAVGEALSDFLGIPCESN
jgi:pimeloyl-ACP methyl ester carboxylesterase